ncbi:hypothetical protein [Actinoplanes sp. NPDC049599]|uniref:hypothetical protein n=1 Tax=Actinoplanes sp. NPDC049599 TaxID=3363903 RepID=UPI003796FB44
MTRSRRAGLSRDEARQQPLYARMLGLQYLAPGGFLCFVFLEGAVALGILLALAELVSWWGVLVLPAMVAVMVKLNDVVAGALIRPAPPAAPPARPSSPGSPGAKTVRLPPTVISQVTGQAPPLRPATARQVAADAVPGAREEEGWSVAGADASALNGPPVTRKWTEDLDDQQQRARQSAARRYE